MNLITRRDPTRSKVVYLARAHMRDCECAYSYVCTVMALIARALSTLRDHSRVSAYTCTPYNNQAQHKVSVPDL